MKVKRLFIALAAGATFALIVGIASLSGVSPVAG